MCGHGGASLRGLYVRRRCRVPFTGAQRPLVGTSCPDRSVRNRSHHVRRIPHGTDSDAAGAARAVRGGRHPTGGCGAQRLRSGDDTSGHRVGRTGESSRRRPHRVLERRRRLARLDLRSRPPSFRHHRAHRRLDRPVDDVGPHHHRGPRRPARRRSRSRLPGGLPLGSRGVARPLQRREGSRPLSIAAWASSPRTLERHAGRLSGAELRDPPEHRRARVSDGRGEPAFLGPSDDVAEVQICEVELVDSRRGRRWPERHRCHRESRCDCVSIDGLHAERRWHLEVRGRQRDRSLGGSDGMPGRAESLLVADLLAARGSA